MIGVSTIFYGYGGEPIVTKIRKIAEIFKQAGYPPFIQIGAADPRAGYDQVVRGAIELKETYEIKYSLHQSVWLPSKDFYINLASSIEEIRKKSLWALKRSIDFARDIEAKRLSFHAGYATNTVTQEEEFLPVTPSELIPLGAAYRNSIASIEELLDYAGDDVQLSVENFNYRPERGYLFSLPKDFAVLPKKIGVILNAGHVYYCRMKLKDRNYQKQLIDSIAGRVFEMHVNDNDGSEDQHMLVAHGKVPLRNILKDVLRHQKMPDLIIESHKKRHGYSDDDLKNNIAFVAKLGNA
ncbi:MAG: sugar phosphate isomerase/epimerase [Thaumarchaeota archaeon]|nr:sugar phosphate isomerase/epimerase [Nitrososphaerota archaeon]